MQRVHGRPAHSTAPSGQPAREPLAVSKHRFLQGLTCSDLDLDLDLDLWPFEPKLARQLLVPRVTFAPTPVFLRLFSR